MELEGVTDVRPADEDYQYFFTVRPFLPQSARALS